MAIHFGTVTNKQVRGLRRTGVGGGMKGACRGDDCHDAPPHFPVFPPPTCQYDRRVLSCGALHCSWSPTLMAEDGIER